MRIVVCVKHVPDLMADRRLGPDGRVERDGGDGTLNELDENAVEAALVIAEEHDAEVVALTMGPDDAEDAVRRALQMGADQGVHVLDDALAGTDVFGTARVLAAAVRSIAADGPVDLVITGMASLDALTSMLPAALAAELGLPQLTLAVDVQVAGGAVQVRRDLDHATEVLRAPLPALVSVTDQANEPRYPAFAGIMAARKKPVRTLDLGDLGIDPAAVGAAGARTRVLTAEPRPPRTDRVLITDEGDAGVRLADFLAEHKLV
ncbi:electron transfer flavoprotein subunit beta/FixA family protein [Isoptericola sp. b441]|uniref:Electron transfer flavoprotein subunit beta n=1 Tax=Actinotalea lenta TaxID=3064654 RepID=A0ABT9DDD8_9CELL|nr:MULTISPECIES: electron transfer flavoprotein subunit beta/FixA family protein [unclassified Isoptericola]MDO8108248.1 electron transfer flavoprotein subunit beta/FixA family protein [Isoptericola sp. b441]MDO8120079.1 electron transfer flavoprotein subunit beta/FixA family protein [Isoptericola sp. b490]